jgi:hypothetical protein
MASVVLLIVASSEMETRLKRRLLNGGYNSVENTEESLKDRLSPEIISSLHRRKVSIFEKKE